MAHRIEVCLNPSLPDPAGRRLKARIASDLGITVDDVRTGDEYLLDLALDREQLRMLVEEVFQDPVTQDATIDQPLNLPFDWLIEVGFRPGVTDNVGRTAREAVTRTLALGPGFGAGGVYSEAPFHYWESFQGTGERNRSWPSGQ